MEDLYKFRDRYFENHSLEHAINRNQDTKNELDAVLKVFVEHEGTDIPIIVVYLILYAVRE